MSKKVRWGIAGPGNISRKFAEACGLTESSELIAVASTNEERASEFAKKYDIKYSYGSYDELMKNDEVDAVYIGTINSTHMSIIEECAKHKKAVLCEKPMVMTEKEVDRVIELQKEHNVLIMEAIWTFFLPVTLKVKSWVDEGKIGKIRNIESIFAFNIPFDKEHRLYNKEIGGGTMFDMGVYSISYPIFFANSEIQDLKTFNQKAPTDVDEFGITLMQFESGMIATSRYSMAHQSLGTSYIYGDKGYAIVQNFWAGKSCALYDRQDNLIEEFENDGENGFIYEVEHFNELFLSGKKESEINTLAKTKLYAKIFDHGLNNAKW